MKQDVLLTKKSVLIVAKPIYGLLSILVVGLGVIGLILWRGGPVNPDNNLDAQLAELIEQAQLSPVDLGQIPDDPEKIALGQALFFDKELSGNRDVACATCHHPLFSGDDELALSIGVGGEGIGPERTRGQARPFVPRNATEIFNRGAVEWQTMFWDGRVFQLAEGVFDTPADEELPAGLDNIVAIQAMFPVSSNTEMRGKKGDTAVDGRFNELAAMNEDDFTEIWQAVMARLLAIPEYADWFARVYPDVPVAELGFHHAANAIAAFEIASFSFDDSPWDRYLRGETDALSADAKQGALLFYGQAGCATCHSGNMMTDQQYYNILVPQIGPGRGNHSGYDIGRGGVTGEAADAFAFRTPPLRNVAITGPWMHNGAYGSLEAVVRHHISPLSALQQYAAEQLPADLAGTYRDDLSTVLIMSETYDPLIENVPDLTDEQIQQLLAFLQALTSETAVDLSYLIPDTVPSGLPVDR